MGHWKILKVIWKLASLDSQSWKCLEFLRWSKPTCQMSLFLYSGSPIWLLLYRLTVPSSGIWGHVQHLQGSEQAVPGALLEHWCSLPSPLSLWNVLWVGISAGSSHPGAFSMRLALLQTGNKRENAGEGGLPEDTVTLWWDWLLPVCLLLAAGFPNPSVSGSALLVCLPAPIQHGREDGYTSQDPPSRSLSPPVLEPGCPHWAMPSTCHCDTSKASLPCSGAHAHTEPGLDCEEGVWIFLQVTVKQLIPTCQGYFSPRYNPVHSVYKCI